ncbi:hypothetical protein [Micromonospora sp. ATCC 39149]|uniref:hypothetical protein n=1 Tax=Micromonospora sp. (strain ATCC 39149 / NRRL 15099 / SCC 1413) TaxID=219305 RepID=UPI0002F8B21D|nr:hypothetical protein [Micromonospora sp. ATCC 39149]
MRGDGGLVDTVFDEVEHACARHGGRAARSAGDPGVDLVLALRDAGPLPAPVARVARSTGAGGSLGTEGYLLARAEGVTMVLADTPAGLLYGLFHVVRLGAAAFDGDRPARRHAPAVSLRMLDHWDNVDVHPVMGQVERGYAGGSIFWHAGAARRDLDRVRAYGRLLGRVRRQRDSR